MKFTLKEVRVLERSLYQITKKELPIRISYRLAKLLQTCLDELSTLEKARLELINKYPAPEVQNPPDKATPEELERENKIREEFALLLEEAVEIPFEPLTVEELGDINISTLDMLGLFPIIKEEKEKGI